MKISFNVLSIALLLLPTLQQAMESDSGEPQKKLSLFRTEPPLTEDELKQVRLKFWGYEPQNADKTQAIFGLRWGALLLGQTERANIQPEALNQYIGFYERLLELNNGDGIRTQKDAFFLVGPYPEEYKKALRALPKDWKNGSYEFSKLMAVYLRLIGDRSQSAATKYNKLDTQAKSLKQEREALEEKLARLKTQEEDNNTSLRSTRAEITCLGQAMVLLQKNRAQNKKEIEARQKAVETEIANLKERILPSINSELNELAKDDNKIAESRKKRAEKTQKEGELTKLEAELQRLNKYLPKIDDYPSATRNVTKALSSLLGWLGGSDEDSESDNKNSANLFELVAEETE